MPNNEDALAPMLICTQPPVISENLLDLNARVSSITTMLSTLPPEPENLPQVKKARADLRRYFESLEEQRKAVKAAVMAPYNDAEAKYKALVSGPIGRADKLCKDFVDGVETSMKRQCEESLREYFAELCAANHVEFLTFEQAGIQVDMASARQKTPKKLREQLTQFVSRVSSDVDSISEMEDAEEILVEYKQSLSLSSAIGIVLDRHRRIQQQREESLSRASVKSSELEAVHKVDAIAPPVPVQPPKEEKRYTISFTLRPTESQMKKLRPFLIELKDFLIQEGIEYG